jgi:hypothetical protein
MTFSTGMLCKEKDTPALRFRKCSQNVDAKHVHGLYAIVLCAKNAS